MKTIILIISNFIISHRASGFKLCKSVNKSVLENVFKFLGDSK